MLPENALIVHTSGTQPLDNLERWMGIYSDVPVQTGVFYPLQTFTKGQPFMPFDEIPLCLEAADKATENQLVDLGQQISDVVYLMTSTERQLMHVAAVLAGNFTNHLLTLAHDLTESNGLEFNLLRPLIAETMRKGLATNNPAEVQTGPARRNDLTTIDTHLTLLAGYPQLSEIYQVMTQSIQQLHSR